jgi:hypothetical protein
VIRALGYLATEAFWTVVHRLLDKRATWDHDDDPAADTAARTAWVRDHRRPSLGGD